MSKRIYCPSTVWVIRYGGLQKDLDAEPVCITTTTKYSAINIMLPKIVERLEQKYPNEVWFEDVIDRIGKGNFRKESFMNPKIFVSVEKTKFCEYACFLPGVDDAI